MDIKELLNNDKLGITIFLTKAEEIEIFKYLYDNPEEKELVQTILLKANRKLVLSIVRKYKSLHNVEVDDLIQFGNIGLLIAVDHFDITKNTKFSSYATFWIKENISRELQKFSNEIHQPINVINIRKKYYEIEHELISELKREVTIEEVAARMNIDSNELMLILSFTDNNIISLNDNVGDSEIIDLVDGNGVTQLSNIIKEEERKLIKEAIDSMNENERKAILYRYGYVDGLYHTLEETSLYIGVTRQRVKQIETKALEKMRTYLKGKI